MLTCQWRIDLIQYIRKEITFQNKMQFLPIIILTSIHVYTHYVTVKIKSEGHKL